MGFSGGVRTITFPAGPGYGNYQPARRQSTPRSSGSSGGSSSSSSSGSRTTSHDIRAFRTSAPPKEYDELINMVRSMWDEGPKSLKAYQDLQRQQGLEMARNAVSSRGIANRSGVGASAETSFLGQFNPMAAMQNAEFMSGLLGRMTGAVAQGREQYAPVNYGTTENWDQSSSSTGSGSSDGGRVGGYSIDPNPYGRGIPGLGPGYSLTPGGGGSNQSGHWVGTTWVPGPYNPGGAYYGPGNVPAITW